MSIWLKFARLNSNKNQIVILLIKYLQRFCANYLTTRDLRCITFTIRPVRMIPFRACGTVPVSMSHTKSGDI